MVSVDVKHHVYSLLRLVPNRIRVQELCESRGGRPGLSVLISLTVSVHVKQHQVELCFGIGHSLSLICQPTSEDMKLYITTTKPHFTGRWTIPTIIQRELVCVHGYGVHCSTVSQPRECGCHSDSSNIPVPSSLDHLLCTAFPVVRAVKLIDLPFCSC